LRDGLTADPTQHARHVEMFFQCHNAHGRLPD
jgi:hypothetical protein